MTTVYKDEIISIHTPTKGVTVYGVAVWVLDIHISIHTPTKGVTALAVGI